MVSKICPEGVKCETFSSGAEKKFYGPKLINEIKKIYDF